MIPYSQLSLHERRSIYARSCKGYLNMEAVFSDETEQFVSPFDPDPGDTVTIKLRTAQNDADQAYIHLCVSYGEQKRSMVKTESDELFDYYSVSVSMAEPVRYYFSVSKEGRLYFYNKRGLYDSADPVYHFRIIPGFRVPSWARGAVMYQIFVDRFYNGDPSNDPVNYEYIYLAKPARNIPWDTDVAVDDVCNFYGGDLRGIMEKMAYLKGLGVEVLYLNPIFVSPSNHKYDIQDYDHVDPHYGVIVNDAGEALNFERLNNRFASKYVSRTTDALNLEASDKLLAELIELAHENGIRVILDGVFNHCGSFNKWLDKAGFYMAANQRPRMRPLETGVSGMEMPAAAPSEFRIGAYRDEKSPYHDYFLWYDRNWPNNDCYDSWWGNENHPKLNYEASPALCQYMLDIAKKWVSPPYNADGWRLDVAADLGRSQAFNHQFWQKFRAAVREANPEAIVLAEHYGDSSAWLNGLEWDTVMNYDAFMVPITWFLTGMNKHSEESLPHLRGDAMAFENAMRYHSAQFTIHSLQSAMNELSNHDHSRFLTRTNRTPGRLHTLGSRAAETGVDKNVMMEAVVFQMTWPGAPTLYYGDEAGLAGWTDPDNRRPYPWGKEDALLMEVHRIMISLRQQYPVLRCGSLEFLYNDRGFISYGRWDKRQKLVIALNNNEHVKETLLPVWKIGFVKGRMERLVMTFDGRIAQSPKPYAAEDGMVRVTMPPASALVLTCTQG